MSNPNNPFDASIPDPIDPEQMIEDPLHGPSAVNNLLEIPAMPLGDGTYYQPGGFYAVGTPYFDASGRPIYLIGLPSSALSPKRESHDLDEWLEASQLGEEFLIALEGKRQRERMGRTGFAHAFKSTDVCGGGQRLSDCKTAESMTQDVQKITATNQQDALNEGRTWNTPLSLSRICGSCALSCQVAYETDNGQLTGITRFTTTRPLDDVKTICVDVAALLPAELTEEMEANLHEAFRKAQGLAEDESEK